MVSYHRQRIPDSGGLYAHGLDMQCPYKLMMRCKDYEVIGIKGRFGICKNRREDGTCGKK